MLFNSPVFIFAFLPIVLIGYYFFGRTSSRLAKIWLAVASLFFYGWWNPVYLLLLLFAMTVNFAVGAALQNDSEPRTARVSREHLLYFGVLFNVAILGYFKYSMFAEVTFNQIFDAHVPVHVVILPLAISFFTFQKIAYIVDSYSGRVKEPSFLNYSLFVGFFPQLIAGPIVHYSEILPQFRRPETYRFNWVNFTDGLSLFMLGLAKKVVLADEFARYSDASFNGVAHGAAITLVPAWVGALAYTLQLYFDFSGYSDMALGLGRMMNVQLPINFNSPYQAHNIIDFWRRWHITLSRFLREYIYIPLGGNRFGVFRRYLNLMATMLIGGLWHGAGWTFVIWGALHGAYLCVNHFWQAVFHSPKPSRAGRVLAQALTLLAVILAWVLFRAADLPSAIRLYAGMLGSNGAIMPEQLLQLLPPLRLLFSGAGTVPLLGDSTVMGTLEILVMLILGYGIVLFGPNLYQMTWKLRILLVVVSFAFTFQKVIFAGDTSSFIYFRF